MQNYKNLNTFRFTNQHKFKYEITEKYLTHLKKVADTSSYKIKDYNLFFDDYRKRQKLPFSWTNQEDNQFEYIKDNRKLGYLIYRYKFKNFTINKIISDFPTYVLIELASLCNLRCQMCYQTDKTFTNKKFMGSMSFELYKSIIDQLVEGGTGALTFGSRGEPLMNTDIIKCLNYAKNKFYELKLITNASFLNEEISHSILQNEVNLLTFSVDSHLKDEYEEIRQRGNFDRVLKNILTFLEIKNKYYPNSKTITRISGVQVLDTQNINQFNEFWQKFVDEVGIKKAYERWDTYFNEPTPEFKKPCSLLWERMYIWYDGKVNPCDSDYKSYLSYGDVTKESIKDIWGSNMINKLREDHIKLNRNDYNPCDRCGVC